MLRVACSTGVTVAALILLTGRAAAAEPLDALTDALGSSPVVEEAVEAAGPAIDPLVDALDPVLETAGATVAPVTTPIVEPIQPIVEPVLEGLGPIGELAEPITEPLLDPPPSDVGPLLPELPLPGLTQPDAMPDADGDRTSNRDAGTPQRLDRVARYRSPASLEAVELARSTVAVHGGERTTAAAVTAQGASDAAHAVAALITPRTVLTGPRAETAPSDATGAPASEGGSLLWAAALLGLVLLLARAFRTVDLTLALPSGRLTATPAPPG